MIEEIVPGIAHWKAFHPGIGRIVHSSLVLDSGTLIDPMVPEDGLEGIGRWSEPRRIVLTNRHHFRHSRHIAERFDCPVLCHEAGLSEFAADQRVFGFAFGDRVAMDVQALELGCICAEETLLAISGRPGALCVGDAITRSSDGSLSFMPDAPLGDEPESVRECLRSRLQAVLDLDFDALLLAHGAPVLEGAKARLARLVGPRACRDGDRAGLQAPRAG